MCIIKFYRFAHPDKQLNQWSLILILYTYRGPLILQLTPFIWTKDKQYLQKMAHYLPARISTSRQHICFMQIKIPVIIPVVMNKR
jgi:hypothetical protein